MNFLSYLNALDTSDNGFNGTPTAVTYVAHQVTVPFNAAKGTVFFRLVRPY